jgi:polyhydroxybutyrate depolymerase
MHGGGGSKEEMEQLTCPGGDTSNSGCLNKLADRSGFAVVYPNGTEFQLKNVRTFNAGGGTNGFACVSGGACSAGVDEISYFNALLDDVEQLLNVDRSRVYATGFSNGAAMSHRLACDLSDRIAAIAPVSAANQLSTTMACSPPRPVPVLHIHGTADPCWPYMGGAAGCTVTGNMLSVTDSMVGTASKPGWTLRNECGITPDTVDLPVVVSDGTSITRIAFSGCRHGADVIHYRVNGGGHRWPGGYMAPSVGGIDTGKLSNNMNASEVIWEFFRNHPKQSP